MAGLLDFFTSKDPDDVERRLRFAQGLGGMTTNPNQALQAGLQSRIEGIQANRAATSKADLVKAQSNATFEALRAAGVPDEVLAIAKNSPELAKTITGSFIKAKMGTGHMLKFSGIQTDPITGQQYNVMSNPNTGTNERVDVTGAIAQTPQGKITMESGARLNEADIAKATDVGQQAFGRAGVIDEMLTKLQTAKRAVKDGASSGIIARYVPSFNAATSELRSMANMLGIDIINSATFGALSEKELQLALSTGLDLSLQGEELRQHIDDKINAQTKMRDALLSKARVLTGGNKTYSSYIQEMSDVGKRESPIVNFQTPDAQPKGGVTFSQSQIDRMNPAQKKLFESLMGG